MKQLLWLKFYPKDWNGDHELRRCSLAARGFLASMLEPMHKAEPYGHLLLRGKAPDYTELADIASCTLREVKYSIEELLKTGALSTTDDGIIYSRRMVRDAARRLKQAEFGKRGGQLRAEAMQSHQPVTDTTLKGGLKPALHPEARGQRLEVRDQRKAEESSAASAEPPSPTVLTFPTVGPVATWALTEAQIAKWQGYYPALDVLGECQKALDWCEVNPSKRKTARGMPAFLSRWLMREVDKSPQRSMTVTTGMQQGRTDMLATATKGFLES